MTGVATLRQRPFLWAISLAGYQRGVGDAAPYTQHGNHSPTKIKKRNLRIQVTLQAQNSLFSLDSASGANALASTAIDAGSCIDNSLVLHADCTNGAGVNTCTASNALAGNGMSHRELLISVLNGIVPLPALHGCSPVWHTAGLLCLLRYT